MKPQLQRNSKQSNRELQQPKTILEKKKLKTKTLPNASHLLVNNEKLNTPIERKRPSETTGRSFLQ